jgi:hypothetical protein
MIDNPTRKNGRRILMKFATTAIKSISEAQRVESRKTESSGFRDVPGC